MKVTVTSTCSHFERCICRTKHTKKTATIHFPNKSVSRSGSPGQGKHFRSLWVGGRAHPAQAVIQKIVHWVDENRKKCCKKKSLIKFLNSAPPTIKFTSGKYSGPKGTVVKRKTVWRPHNILFTREVPGAHKTFVTHKRISSAIQHLLSYLLFCFQFPIPKSFQVFFFLTNQCLKGEF